MLRKQPSVIVVPLLEFLSCILPHLRDFQIVITRYTCDCDQQTAHVDGREFVVEHDSCRTDGDHLLEDAANAQRNDRSALEERKLCCDHAKCQRSRDEQQEQSFRSTFFGNEEVDARDDGIGLLSEHGDDEEREKHDRRQEEECRERVRRRGMAEQQDLSEGPSEARKEGGGHCEREAKGVEGGLAVDHEEDSQGHGEDDGC